ncbi:hypothetical protein AB0467_15900 [Streptomyces sp. NPDC052095]|uniref:hypothetical protein n=1 Tax=unclassified Streptomyces TaxID=2593676 RepID=UPI003450B391
MHDRIPDGDEYEDGDGDGPARASGRWRSCFLVTVLAVLLVAGGVTRLFWDDLVYPFGDPRACNGSDAALPAAIEVGGALLPQDATDVRYYTHEGKAVVSFVSDQVPDYLVRTGSVPDTDSLFADGSVVKYGMAPGDTELPKGLCGEGLRAPVWYGGAPSAESILVERSPLGFETLRSPARVQVTFLSTDPAP